jgi:hypothetical protein
MYELSSPNEEPDPQDEFHDVSMQFAPGSHNDETPGNYEADIERQVEEALAGVMASLEDLSMVQMTDDPELREEIDEDMGHPEQALLSFRQPFGEDYEPSDSDAELAKNSFHQAMDSLLDRRTEADMEVNALFIIQRLDVHIAAQGHPSILAKLYRQTNIRSGGCRETVRLYEQDRPDDPKRICDYVTGNGVTVTRRYDYDDLYDMPGGTDFIDEADTNATLRDAVENINLAFAMRLNGAPVGSDEINGLRDFLAQGTPQPPQRHE